MTFTFFDNCNCLLCIQGYSKSIYTFINQYNSNFIIIRYKLSCWHYWLRDPSFTTTDDLGRFLLQNPCLCLLKIMKMVEKVWSQLDYTIDVCCLYKGAHNLEHL